MKELENKISSVFLPEKQVVVNARETDTADSVRYKYDITFDGQSPRNYIAMQKMPENDDFVEREIIAPAFAKVRKRENENKLNLGSSPREDIVRDKGLSEIRVEKKEDTDYVAPVFKGAIGGAADRAWTAYSSVYHGGMDLGSWVAELKTGDEKNTNIDEEVRRSIAQSMMSKEKVMKFLNLVLDENDSKTGYELGNVFGSVLESFAIAGLTKSTSAMAAYLGLSSGGGAYEELRYGGVQPLESAAVAFGVGFTGGMLERYGLHNLIEAWSTKRLRSAVFKSMAGEFIQEASQTGAEEFLMAPYREGYQPEILKEMATAGVYGAIGGLFGFGLGRAMNTRARNYYKSLLQKDYNMSPEKADELVEAVFIDNEQAKKELKELIDNETIATLENDNAVEDAKQVMQEGKDLLDRMLAQKAMGLSDEVQAKADEFAETMKQQALSAGESEDVADATSSMAGTLIRNIAEERIKRGLTADEAVSDLMVDIVGGGNKAVDENLQEVSPDIFALTDPGYDAVDEYMTPEQRQNEIDEERIATMVEDGGMSVEEATFRVKTGREPTELDKALGYDFIQYQIGERIRKIDAERLAFERKDINPDLIGRESEVKEAVDINRFFADRKASKEIGIDEVMAAVDANVGQNENGVRVLKNSVTGETATLSNNSISKMFSTTAQHASDNIGGILGKEAIANIGSIFNTAVLIKTMPDAKHGTKNRIRRYANVIRSDGENFIVKITVKELANKRPELTNIEIEDNEGRDLSAYDMKVGRKNTAGNSLGSFAAGANATVAHNSGNNISINDLIDFVNSYSEDSIQINGKKRAARNSAGRRIARTEEGLRAFYEWFGDSLIVDEKGRPLVVYHGRDARNNFAEFKPNISFRSGFLGSVRKVLSPVFFFTPSKTQAHDFAVNRANSNFYAEVLPLYLSISNPIDLTDKNAYKLANRLHLTDRFGEVPAKGDMWKIFDEENNIKILKEAGYDGAIISERAAAKSFGNKDKLSQTTYVAFSPNQIKSVDNRGSFSRTDDNIYYQTGKSGEGEPNLETEAVQGTAAGQSRQNRMIYRVMGQYEPAKKLITLFQGKDTTTLTHELLHHYLPIYLTDLEKAGRFDKLEGLYRELGVTRMADMGREEWEKLVDLGTSYIFYNQAPNEASKSIFERAKQWMMDAYNTVKKFVKPSPEVTKFFDGLFARDASTLPDVSDLKGRTAELAKILQGAKNGQELTVNGLSLRDISRLRQALYARVPAAGKTLADEIRSAGGIDTESELARQLGYDSRKGTEGGFWNYKGTIKDESQLIDFLKANGYLEETTENTYEETSSVWDKVQQLIDRRNDTYNEKEQSRQMARDSALAAGQVVSEILNQHYIGDVKKLEEDLKAATKMLADRGAAAVDKATLDYLTFSLKQMEKDYQRLLYQKKEERYNYQEKLTKFIKDLPLDYNHKSKFMDKIRMVKDEKSFNKYLKETKERAEKYIEQEQRRMLSDLIQSEVKSSRPRKVMAQKYDYENNVLFKDLRDYNKMTQSEAAAALAALDETEQSVDNPGSRGYLLRRLFLEYKANGMDSSSELMRQLYEMIGEAKQLGQESKEESEFEKSFEREQDRRQIIDKLDASKADKNKWTTMATNVYRRGITNLYSMLNSIAGKEIADKYEMETVIDRKEQKEWKHLKKTSAKAEVIYKVKSYGDLLNVMADKGQEVAVLYGKDGKKYDLSVLDIIDIYNAIKNKKTRQDYEEAYGAEQINRLISLLSPEDRAFGDMLMEDVNSRFSELNKVYVRIYGMDLKKVENYWMGSAEHVEPVDIFNDFRQQSTTPGFFKERKTGKVTPVAKNAWIKYQKHISQSYYMTDVAEKYKQLADIFKSKRIENQIENHFGSGVYQTLRKQIENIGLNAQSPLLDDVSGYFQKLLNNWVGAKVSVNPVVFVGQLTSFTNYAEGVNLSAFIKNIGYALAHPIEVKDFMMKYNGDFLQHRYEAGFNEAMSRFIEGAKETNGKNFGLSAKAKFNYSNALSSFVRIGDLGAIIYGGYGQFKTLLDSGMSVEEARRKFEFSTLRSQQSGNAASISDWQQQRGIARLYLAFKNTSLQYTRKIADTVIMLQNGDISREEAAKVLTNYLLIQPAFWVIAKNIAKSLLGLGDDDDEFDDGVLEQLLANPIDGVPFVSDMVRYAYREAAGEKNYSLFSTPLLDDVEKSFRKIGKEDKDFYDFADIVTPFIEMLTSAPAGTAKRYMKIYNEKWGE